MLSTIMNPRDATAPNLQEDVCINFCGAQRSSCVGSEEGVAGARAEDDNAAPLKVPDGAPPDVRLSNLPHLDGGLDSGLDSQRIQR